jgi:hypothetical protein
MDPVITEQVSREHSLARNLDDFLAELANAGRLPSHPARPRSSGEGGRPRRARRGSAYPAVSWTLYALQVGRAAGPSG